MLARYLFVHIILLVMDVVWLKMFLTVIVEGQFYFLLQNLSWIFFWLF